MLHLPIGVMDRNFKIFTMYEVLLQFLCVASPEAHGKDGNTLKGSSVELRRKPHSSTNRVAAVWEFLLLKYSCSVTFAVWANFQVRLIFSFYTGRKQVLCGYIVLGTRGHHLWVVRNNHIIRYSFRGLLKALRSAPYSAAKIRRLLLVTTTTAFWWDCTGVVEVIFHSICFAW